MQALAEATKKRVVLAPLDPVHDIGLKMIRRGLEKAGHETILLQPDLKPEEIVQAALEKGAECVLISRTLGYGVAESLARFVDLAEAAGLRNKARLGVGGMAIRPELAAELGFDAGFGPGTTVEEAVAFVEGRPYEPASTRHRKEKADITLGYSYAYRHSRIGELLDRIGRGILDWVQGKSSPAVRRGALRREMLRNREMLPNGSPRGKIGASVGISGGSSAGLEALREEYLRLSDPMVAAYYIRGENPPRTRDLSREELASLEEYVISARPGMSGRSLRHGLKKPVIFAQYGTGCPSMDVAHIKVAEAWGADGVVHFDPSWGARTEGLVEGLLTHEGDGTVITPDNLALIRRSLEPSTLWQVRAHRGLNTPETVVLAGELGADLTKINMVYASLGAGMDPARITVDGVACIKYAAEYGLPFDVVTNEELCGVPAHKAFAGMLAVAHLGRLLGGRPILQPLFCYSPEAMIHGLMEDNYIDFNTAKIMALRSIIDAPIWPGAPVGFLTQTEDRIQSSISTALHAGLASSLEVDGVSIASSDEAYSGGPITAPARVDTLRASAEVFRFFGRAKMEPTPKAREWAEELVEGIEKVLEQVAGAPSFVDALYSGLLGNPEDGAYPGRTGRGTMDDTRA